MKLSAWIMVWMEFEAKNLQPADFGQQNVKRGRKKPRNEENCEDFEEYFGLNEYFICLGSFEYFLRTKPIHFEDFEQK